MPTTAILTADTYLATTSEKLCDDRVKAVSNKTSAAKRFERFVK
jgi:hypothetical protein